MSYTIPDSGPIPSGDRRRNTTGYEHPQETNLLNIHKALQYRFGTGEPELRVNLGPNAFVISGNVNIPGIVQVYSDPDNPIHNHITEVGTSGNLQVPWLPVAGNVTIDSGNVTVFQGTTPWIIKGNVDVVGNIAGITTLPAITGNVGVVGNVVVVQGTTPWTVTGNANVTVVGNIAGITTLPAITGNVGVSGNVSISQMPAITGNVSVTQGSTPWHVDGNVTATINGEVSVAGANPDAFGRARVSELFTLGDYKHIYAIDPNFLDSTYGGGNVAFVADQACAVLSTGSNTAAYAIHQTKFYHHYQPGKSQLIYSSVNFRAPHRNVTKRTGYFDGNDGIYFEQVGSDTADGNVVSAGTQTLNWVIRTYVGGSPSEADYSTTVNGVPYTYKRRVPQSEWNIDKCDGTGASGFNLDITKTQLAWIDFQWLGVGRVRCGFVHNGESITAHEYYHSNVLPTVYIANPNLPVRCEIRNTGTTTGGAFNQICATVMSEGGYVESGIDWSIYTTARATPVPGQTRFPLVAIRLKNSFKGYPNRLSVRPSSLGLFAKTEPIVYEVVKFPSAASLSTTDPGGLVWTSADDDSGVEYCVNATSFTSANGDRFASGYVPSGSSQNSLSPVATGTLTEAKKNIISQNIGSTDSEVYVVIVSTIFSGVQLTADVACAIQWREIY